MIHRMRNRVKRDGVCVVGSVVLIFLMLGNPALARESAAESIVPLVLEFSSPQGSVYLDVLAASDGPVKISVSTEWVEGLLVTAAFGREDLRVAISGVYDDGSTLPLATRELILPEGWAEVRAKYLVGQATDSAESQLVWKTDTEPVPLHELAAVGFEGWTTRLAPLPQTSKDSCECCRCGSLYCCPNAGHCLGCGNCGDCCCTGGGDGKPTIENKRPGRL